MTILVDRAFSGEVLIVVSIILLSNFSHRLKHTYTVIDQRVDNPGYDILVSIEERGQLFHGVLVALTVKLTQLTTDKDG